MNKDLNSIEGLAIFFNNKFEVVISNFNNDMADALTLIISDDKTNKIGFHDQGKETQNVYTGPQIKAVENMELPNEPHRKERTYSG